MWSVYLAKWETASLKKKKPTSLLHVTQMKQYDVTSKKTQRFKFKDMNERKVVKCRV